MSTDAGIAIDGDFTVESNHETEAQIRASFVPDATKEVGSPKSEVEPEAEAKPVEAAVEAKKPRNDPQARIDQVVAKQKEAERRAEVAERRLAELSRPAETKPEAAKPTAQAEWQRFKAMPDAPKLEAFDDFSDWNIAMGVFVADKRVEEREVKGREQSQLQAQEQAYFKVAESFLERFDLAAAMEDKEFSDKVHPRLLEAKALSAMTPRDGKPTFVNFAVEQVMRSEHPKDVLLYLSDQKTAQRLATLHPDDVIRDLAKYEASLGAAQPGPAPKPAKSQATPPIQPVRGSSHVADDDDEMSDDISVDDFIRKENAKARRAAAGR